MRVNPSLSRLFKTTITYQTPEETLLETPETLPTSEPGTAQISWTITDAMLPTYEGDQPISKCLVVVAITGGRFITAGTLYWRLLRNGTSVGTTSKAIAANQYWTIIHGNYSSTSLPTVGTIYTIKLWSNQTDSVWDYKSFQVQVALITMSTLTNPVPHYQMTIEANPTLTLGNPYGAVGDRGPWFYFDIYGLGAVGYALTSEGAGPFDMPNKFSIYNPRIFWGVDYGTDCYTHASYRPYYSKNRCPKIIQGRMLLETKMGQ